MSVVRWGSDWVSEGGMVFRRTDSLSKMMVLSFVLHLAFFSLILFSGRSFLGFSPSAFQSYQVTLVSPPSAPSTAAVAPKPTPHAPAAPPPRPAPPPVTPAKSPPSKGIPPPPAKEDPERLQEWWKKKVGSIKIPPVQPKTDPAPTQSFTRRPMVSPNPMESKTITPQKEEAAAPQHSAAPSPPALKQEASNSPVIATGSASLNVSLFKFPYYLKSIENKISGQWSPPPALLQEELVGAIVQFNVTRRGIIESVEIEKSSGNSQFDQAALRAVYNASPLPPLPDGLTDDPLKVHFSFTVQRG